MLFAVGLFRVGCLLVSVGCILCFRVCFWVYLLWWVTLLRCLCLVSGLDLIDALCCYFLFGLVLLGLVVYFVLWFFDCFVCVGFDVLVVGCAWLMLLLCLVYVVLLRCFVYLFCCILVFDWLVFRCFVDLLLLVLLLIMFEWLKDLFGWLIECFDLVLFRVIMCCLWILVCCLIVCYCVIWFDGGWIV